MQQLNGAYYAGPTNIQKQNADQRWQRVPERQRWQQVPEKQRCQVNREEWAEYEENRLQEKRTKIGKKRSKLLKKRNKMLKSGAKHQKRRKQSEKVGAKC